MTSELKSWVDRFNDKFTPKNESDTPEFWEYGVICTHDDGYFCEHRAEAMIRWFLINYVILEKPLGKKL